MFEFLKHITLKSKLLFLSIFLIFLPGAIISYLSLKSIQDKAENQRIEYQGTADLVRDKLENELFQIETNFRNSTIDTLINQGVNSDIQSTLRRLELLNPAFKNLFLVTRLGALISSSATMGMSSSGNTRNTVDMLSNYSFSQAEKAEFRRSDYSEAISIYKRALAQEDSPLGHALILSCIGRNYYKLGKYAEGIQVYRQLAEYGDESITIGNIPASIVAYYQISKGYLELSLPDKYSGSVLDLYCRLLDNRWDLEGGEYQYYLKSASQELQDIVSKNYLNNSELEKLDKLKIKEKEVLNSIKLMDIIEKYLLNEIRSELNSTISSDIKYRSFKINPDSNMEFAYFLLPPTSGRSELIAVGFQFNEEYILNNLFTGVLSNIELGKDISLGILNEKDSLLLFTEGNQVAQYLVAENFNHSFYSWKVALFDREGKSVEQLERGEKRLYLIIFLGILAVMLIGLIFLTRAVIHESEISRLKSEFVSNVTHELKTPLSLIRMFGETLESGIVTEEGKRKEYYGIIREESERLTHLINNVLDFSKMENDRKEYNFQETDLVLLIRHSLEAYKFHIRDKGFEIVSNLPEEPLMVKMDKDAISQAFLNLLSNAVKFSEKNRFISIEVTKGSGSAVIAVTDRGIGIPREELKKIFDKFYRIPNSRTRSSRGSGLGLTLTRSIVEAHAGTVTVESEPGKGSTFSISIPLL